MIQRVVTHFLLIRAQRGPGTSKQVVSRQTSAHFFMAGNAQDDPTLTFIAPLSRRRSVTKRPLHNVLIVPYYTTTMSEVGSDTSALRLQKSRSRAAKAEFAKKRHAATVKKMKEQARRSRNDANLPSLQDTSAEESMDQRSHCEEIKQLDTNRDIFGADFAEVSTNFQTTANDGAVEDIFGTEDNTLTTFECDGCSHTNEDTDTIEDEGARNNVSSLADLDVSFESYTNSEYDSSYDVDTPEDEYGIAAVAAAATMDAIRAGDESVDSADSGSYISFHQNIESQHNVSTLYEDEPHIKDETLQCVYATFGSTVGELFELCVMGEVVPAKTNKTEREIEIVRNKNRRNQKESATRVISQRKKSDATDDDDEETVSTQGTAHFQEDAAFPSIVSMGGLFPVEARRAEVKHANPEKTESVPEPQMDLRKSLPDEGDSKPDILTTLPTQISSPSSDAYSQNLSRGQRLKLAREMQKKKYGRISPSRSASPPTVHTLPQWQHFSALSSDAISKIPTNEQRAPFDESMDTSSLDEFLFDETTNSSKEEIQNLTTSSLALELSDIKFSDEEDNQPSSALPAKVWASFEDKREPDTPRTTNKSSDGSSQEHISGSVWSPPTASYYYDSPLSKSAPLKNLSAASPLKDEPGTVRKQLFDGLGGDATEKADTTAETSRSFESPAKEQSALVTPLAPGKLKNRSADWSHGSALSDVWENKWEPFSNDPFSNADAFQGIMTTHTSL